jgi:hypothetical protein
MLEHYALYNLKALELLFKIVYNIAIKYFIFIIYNYAKSNEKTFFLT